MKVGPTAGRTRTKYNTSEAWQSRAPSAVASTRWPGACAYSPPLCPHIGERTVFCFREGDEYQCAIR